MPAIAIVLGKYEKILIEIGIRPLPKQNSLDKIPTN